MTELRTKWIGGKETVSVEADEPEKIQDTAPVAHAPRSWSSYAPDIAFWLGLASIFLWEFSLVPILAVVFGGIGLTKSNDKALSSLTGIILGLIFLVVRIWHGSVEW